MARMTPAEAEKSQGCWLEGHRGWSASGELVNIAHHHGMPLDAYDREVVTAYLRGDETITIDFQEHDVTGLVVDQGELADQAEAYLNEHVAPEGWQFGWHDGEFFLMPDEWWQED